MAEQMGIFPLKGTIRDITYFKSSDGFLAKSKGGVNGNRITSDPTLQRVRENQRDFAAAGKAGKVLRTAFQKILIPTADYRMVSRLTQRMHQVLKADVKNPRGERRVVDGDVALLEGFQFNDRRKLSATFFAPYTADINRVTGEMKITIPAFVPQIRVTAPAGATHFKLFSGGAAIDFEDESSSVDVHESPVILRNTVATADIVLSNVVPANSTHPLFLALGVVFCQEINKSMYPLNDKSFNALAIVKVSTEHFFHEENP